ncbi:endoplasmic reticulum protein [Irpex lacteus]|nr:endoplasmic reticulum protein [Irpex lacteus]
MIPWLFLALAVSPVFATVDKTHGVAPDLLPKYAPLTSGANRTWKCLDGSKEISWSAVNDDYCDCRDGSDEPGTGACPDTKFYCKNEGHIGAFIPSSRVNDGLCETDCCDGSDEKPGVCPNRCKEIGDAYKAKLAAERKLRKTGSKIRSSYIAFAQKEKTRIEAEIAAAAQDIAIKQKEVTTSKVHLVERTESSAAELEQKKQSPLYQSLLRHHHALKSLQKEYQKHLEREKALGDILDSLRTGFNPNYQDMAVLNAEEEDDQKRGEVVEALEEGAWTAEELERDLPGLLASNYETLLLEHEKHIGAPTTESLLFDLSAYIPDALQPQYESFHTSRAKQALDEAERSLATATREKSKSEESLSRLFNPEWFGRDGEFKKLDNTCLEKNTGDYTYEVCLFRRGKAETQQWRLAVQPGRFAHWNNANGVPVGSPEYYSKMFYTRGTKCWNGPERSVVLVWTCGTENAITSVQELEKCEYQFTGTSPALCLPPDADTSKRDEL